MPWYEKKGAVPTDLYDDFDRNQNYIRRLLRSLSSGLTRRIDFCGITCSNTLALGLGSGCRIQSGIWGFLSLDSLRGDRVRASPVTGYPGGSAFTSSSGCPLPRIMIFQPLRLRTCSGWNCCKLFRVMVSRYLPALLLAALISEWVALSSELVDSALEFHKLRILPDASLFLGRNLS